MGRRTSAASRADLLASATEEGRLHLEEVGLQRFSLREVSRRVGYSPTALIDWFGSADMLIYRMGADALTRWRERIDAAMSRSAVDPVPALVGAYFDFAADEPETWRALYAHRPVAVDVPGFYQDSLQALASTVISFVGTVVHAERMPEVPALVNSLLATLRGHCEAEMNGSFDLVGAGGGARAAALAIAGDALRGLGYGR